MFRNYLAAALNNLSRNRLYAAISILGLAIGMAAAILTGLYIRDELSFDRFIPGHERLYVVTSENYIPGLAPSSVSWSPAQTAQWLKGEFPGVEATTRLMTTPPGTIVGPTLRHGQVEAAEPIAWVDPGFFSVLPLKIVAGDPDAAIARPDGVVLTRALARKYFGQDAPIGQIVEIGQAPFRVGAVVEDPPSTTNLVQRVFASGLSQMAVQRIYDPMPQRPGRYVFAGRTFLRLSDKAAAAIQRGLPDFARRHLAGPAGWPRKTPDIVFRLVPLDQLHMAPLGGLAGGTIDTEQGNPRALEALGAVAGLIVIIAGINFVNLMTARAGRRMVEVGVRKVVGAERRHLVAQFVGEAVIYSLIALVLAAVLVELVLPGVRAALDRPMAFAYWRDPALLGASLALALGLGVLSGLYPALVQAGFHPVQALKGAAAQTTGGLLVREGLVILQFAVLIGLILAVVVIARQTRFAMNEGLRVAKDQTMIVDLSPVSRPGHPPVLKPRCQGGFVDAVRALPGVRAVACSSGAALDLGTGLFVLNIPRGETVTFGYAAVDDGFFELYGLRPVAGRLLSPRFGGDAISPPKAPAFALPTRVVMNETGVRAMHLASPAAAIGQVLRYQPAAHAPPAVIVGVVPDFGFNLLHATMQPRIYGLYPAAASTLSVKLSGRDIPETVQAIDQAWRRLGEPRAPSRRFVDDYLQSIYLNVLRQGWLIDAMCGVAVFIAALGLFGLAAFTAERRTKEIGVRKAMGASTRDIVRMLIWQFTRPVLWANLVAWPLGWWALERWLHGFSARIALGPGLFLIASAAALAIAWTTVLAHTLKVAAEKPVEALRYE